MRSRSALPLRSAALAVAAALALGLASCGDSDDDATNGGGGSGGADAASTSDGDSTQGGSAAQEGGSEQDGGEQDGGAEEGGSDSDQARATVEALYAALRERDAKALCDQLNPAARKQVAIGGLGPKAKTCTASVRAFLRKADEGGLEPALDAKVESVEVNGRRATAQVSFGSVDRTSSVPLVKIGDEWKLEAVGTPSQ